MKYCGYCGGEISDFATQCSHCGNSLVRSMESISNNPYNPVNNPYQTTNSPQNNDNIYGGYDAPIDMTKGAGARGYSGQSRRANKVAAIIGICFLIAVGVAAFCIIKFGGFGKNKEVKKLVETYMDSIVNGDVDAIIDSMLCKPIIDNLAEMNDLTYNETRQRLMAGLNTGLVTTKIKYKDLSIVSYKKFDKNKESSFRTAVINKFGTDDFFTDLHEVKIKYKLSIKNGAYTQCEEIYFTYKHNGKMFMIPDSLIK